MISPDCFLFASLLLFAASPFSYQKEEEREMAPKKKGGRGRGGKGGNKDDSSDEEFSKQKKTGVLSSSPKSGSDKKAEVRHKKSLHTSLPTGGLFLSLSLLDLIDAQGFLDSFLVMRERWSTAGRSECCCRGVLRGLNPPYSWVRFLAKLFVHT